LERGAKLQVAGPAEISFWSNLRTGFPPHSTGKTRSPQAFHRRKSEIAIQLLPTAADFVDIANTQVCDVRLGERHA
jgi:hypothetical protein